MKKFPSFSFAPKEEKRKDGKNKSRRRRDDRKRSIDGEADRIIREAKEAAEGSDDLFIVDTKGDSGNLQYEKPYKYEVPKYEGKKRVQRRGNERYKAETEPEEVDVQEQTQFGNFSSFADVLEEIMRIYLLKVMKMKKRRLELISMSFVILRWW